MTRDKHSHCAHWQVITASGHCQWFLPVVSASGFLHLLCEKLFTPHDKCDTNELGFVELVVWVNDNGSLTPCKENDNEDPAAYASRTQSR